MTMDFTDLMKKTLSLMVALTMGFFTACSGSDDDEPEAPKDFILSTQEMNFTSKGGEQTFSYVTLKPAGSNMVGLCPFHSENSPSFTVFGSDDHFYCFGCGAGGDVISFVMRMENVDYPTALDI